VPQNLQYKHQLRLYIYMEMIIFKYVNSELLLSHVCRLLNQNCWMSVLGCFFGWESGLVVLEFELRASHLLGRCSTT
jgi:hypothetical protein